MSEGAPCIINDARDDRSCKTNQAPRRPAHAARRGSQSSIQYHHCIVGAKGQNLGEFRLLGRRSAALGYYRIALVGRVSGELSIISPAISHGKCPPAKFLATRRR